MVDDLEFMVCLSFDGETNFQCDLPVGDAILVNVAAGLGDLKPAQIFDGLARTADGVVDSVLDGFGGGAGKFDEFIDVVFHDVMTVGDHLFLLPDVKRSALETAQPPSRPAARVTKRINAREVVNFHARNFTSTADEF